MRIQPLYNKNYNPLAQWIHEVNEAAARTTEAQADAQT